MNAGKLVVVTDSSYVYRNTNVHESHNAGDFWLTKYDMLAIVLDENFTKDYVKMCFSNGLVGFTHVSNLKES